MPSTRIRSYLIAVVSGVVATVAALYVWGVVGFRTGVIGMCQASSDAWVIIFLGLASLVPAAGIMAGWYSRKLYLRKVSAD